MSSLPEGFFAFLIRRSGCVFHGSLLPFVKNHLNNLRGKRFWKTKHNVHWETTEKYLETRAGFKTKTTRLLRILALSYRDFIFSKKYILRSNTKGRFGKGRYANYLQKNLHFGCSVANLIG